MDKPIGNSFSIPEELTQSVMKIREQRGNAFESAKMFMSEVEHFDNALNKILEEHMEILQQHKYVVDYEKMIVTIIEKK